ncbi:unnamed protein product [Schistocephalus solidus]|uniref:adenylate cyclase n=1 Tax=Schistocephalus solidus TaxID=70667 RepID=A0A183S7X2_SCHSO|nr:unnamed protein product [Schistocephalus solidus]
MREGNLLGHQLTDILDVKNASKSTKTQRLVNSIADIRYFFGLRTHLLSDFFDQLTLPHIKSGFRMALTYASLVLCIVLMVFYSRLPVGGNEISEALIFTGFLEIGILYLISVKAFSVEVYRYLSIILITTIGVCILATFSSMTVEVSLQHTLILLLAFVSHTNLQIPTSFLFCFQILLGVGLSAVDTYQEEIPQHPWDTSDGHKAGSGKPAVESLIILLQVISTTGLSIYVNGYNELRFKAAFLRLCQGVEARARKNEAMRRQLEWFDVVMPPEIHTKYLEMLLKNRGRERSSWLFCESYQPVSILIADAVGMSRLVEQYTAYRVMTILNTMFTEFDTLCSNCKCEKISTLGDTYYCVSGCPQPNADHAISCAEFALAIMRSIKSVNAKFKMSLELAVGVHTGHVNAAVLGEERFRFDIYSYDVNTTQNLQSSCPPGKIHISGALQELLPSNYITTPAQTIEAKREEVSAIAGMKLSTVKIPTFYLELTSKNLLDDKTLKRKIKSAFSVKLESLKSKSSSEDLSESIGVARDIIRETTVCRHETSRIRHLSSRQRPKNHWTVKNPWNKPPGDDRISSIRKSFFGQPVAQKDFLKSLSDFRDLNAKDLQLIQQLRSDPDRHAQLFRAHPLDALGLQFLDPAIEEQYWQEEYDRNKPIYIDSLKLAPAFDMVVVFIYLTAFVVCSIVATAFDSTAGGVLSILTVAINFLGILPVTFWINFSILVKDTKLTGMLQKKLVIWGRQRKLFEIMLFFIAQIPTIFTIIYYVGIRTERFSVRHEHFILCFGTYAIFIHCLPMNSRFWIRILASSISTLTIETLLFVYAKDASAEIDRTEFGWFYESSRFQPQTLGPAVVLFAAWVLVIGVSRKNESSCRLAFYMNVEAEKAYRNAMTAINDCDDLLHNFVPVYVFNILQAQGRTKLESDTVNHAVLVQLAGIAFIRITNFFDGYYREDYQGGKQALGLLNKIICMLDRHLRLAQFKDVEKLKSFNDSYMVAAGINMEVRMQNMGAVDHVVTLMNFCHSLFALMDRFNADYIIGSEKFTIAIGLDVGSVTAGLLGTLKPSYDVWGHPSSQAYKLHRAAKANQVLVKGNVKRLLESSFDFEPIDAKGTSWEKTSKLFCCKPRSVTE